MAVDANIASTILDYLARNAQRRFKDRELAHLLHSDAKKAYPDFKDTLRALAAEGRIVENPRFRYSARRASHNAVGTLSVNTRGFGFVSIPDQPEDIYIERGWLGTAFHGDTVEIEIFGSKGRPAGRVRGIRERKTTRFVGTYLRDGKIGYVLPEGSRGRRDFAVLPDEHLNAKDHDKVVVELVRWESEYVNPEVRITRVIGPSDKPGVDMEMVARAHNLRIEFSDDVLKAADAFSNRIPRNEIKQRLDMRKVPTITIDPADAKDFDDALSLETLPNGHRRLGVHIADVSWYVQEGSPIDREARKRATSVYLPGWCIPMLPPRLSEDLCSLRPKIDRRAMTILMELDAKAKVVHAEFRESVIHSHARFTYEKADQLIRSKSKSAMAVLLRDLKALSEQLRAKRLAKGGLDFDLPEITFSFDPEGALVDILPKILLPTHALVEECMLLANVSAVRITQEYNKQQPGRPLPIIYRIHESPNPEKMEDYYKLLKYLKIPFSPGSRPTVRLFQKVLAAVKGTPEQSLVEEVTLRTMQKAVYDINNAGHFALGFKHYTHFTSPIRRYPDLMLHRMLKEYCNPVGPERTGRLHDQIPRWCEWSSACERVAMEVEREGVKIKQLQFLKEQVGEVFNGVIAGVKPFGLFIELEGVLAQGLIHVRDLENDYYNYDERQYALVGGKTGHVYRMADAVKVQIIRIDEEDRKLDLIIAKEPEDEKPEHPMAKRRKKRKRK
jgi:ribonuclease R